MSMDAAAAAAAMAARRAASRPSASLLRASLLLLSACVLSALLVAQCVPVAAAADLGPDDGAGGPGGPGPDPTSPVWPTNPAHVAALTDLYHALGGPQWRDNTGWADPAVDPCAWSVGTKQSHA